MDQMLNHKFIHNIVEDKLTQTNYFYQINVSKKLVMAFDSLGNLKTIRKIPIPSNSHLNAAGLYLLCLVNVQLTIINLFDPTSPILSCIWQGAQINHAQYNSKSNLIFIIDANQILYQLMIEETIKVREIWRFDTIVDRMSISYNSQIIVYIKQRKQLVQLEINFNNDKVDQGKIKIEKNVLNFYVKGKWTALIIQNPEDQNPFLKVNDLHFFSLRSNGEYVFSHNGERMFLCYDKMNKQVAMVHDNLIIHQLECDLEGKSGNKLVTNEIMFSAEENYQYQIKILVKSYNKMESIFKSSIFQFIRVKQKDNYISLQKNIDKIFKLNGLINPHFQPLVSFILQENHNLKTNMYFQKHMQDQIQIFDQDISYYFFVYLFDSQPTYLPRIAHHFLSYSVTLYQLQRFLQFTEKIFNDYIISESLKLPQPYSLRNLVEFWQILVSSFSKQNVNQNRQSQNLIKYKKILKRGKSFYLILSMMENNFKQNILKMFKKFSQHKKHPFFQTQHLWIGKKFNPKLCHQFFSKFSSIKTDDKLQINFAKALIKNADNLYQTAYFFYFINNPKSIPFLPYSYVEFFQALNTLPPFPQERINYQPLSLIASMSIQTQQLSFIKYVCQLSIYYQQPQIIGLILKSDYNRYKKDEQQQQDQLNNCEYLISCFIIIGLIDDAYLWINKIQNNELKNELFKILIRGCINKGYLTEMLELCLNTQEIQILKKQTYEIIKNEEIQKIIEQKLKS